ncbi:unnamed protein product [Effrenium voratum]|nr:unnamed protein product [Effrenium voratum]
MAGKEGRRKLFSPAGPITARHSKKEEWLIPQSNSVWNKSGPPTKEARMLKTDVAAPLVNLDEPSRRAAQACVEMRRDLNTLARHSRPGTLLQKEAAVPTDNAREIWESLEFTSLTTEKAKFEKTIERLNLHRSLDAKDAKGAESSASP